jgi:ubiquinone/menaquinone biosynthesis C-methylase UbiE
MVERARAAHPGVEFLLADAQALPFAEGSFHAVSARHMLYHVPDISKALAECWRVLRRGGRFLAITNADGYMAGFWRAVWEGLGGVGGFEAVMAERNLNQYLHNRLVTMVFEHFGNAELKIVESALEFASAEPALRYFSSMQSYYGIDDATWARGTPKVQRVFAERVRGGVWRVEKPVALITALKM